MKSQRRTGQGSNESIENTPETHENVGVVDIERLQIDRKRLVCTLKKNRRGHFLRISEEAGAHRNTIIIPASGLKSHWQTQRRFDRETREPHERSPGGFAE